jgi:flagellar biosynthesis protein FlhA
MFDALAQKLGLAKRRSDLILACAVIFILLLLIIPLTGFALDALITISIMISVMALLVTLYSEDALSFNAFPSFLLFLTLFRLGLNIATTRMILTEAHAGAIIDTFGHVVTGGNAFVGFVIFLLLTGINFVVITKGSGRVAEVAARFTLDSLPGKQLAIDADVNAGLIDEKEAKARRDKIMTEADFYGAMDGASKFVRGDAIAGIVIILVNIFGGFIVGMVMKGMTLEQVVQTYVMLTVGNGLVIQIPALLVSVAAGIIVTRSSSKENLAESFRKQLFNNPKVLSITALTVMLLIFVPGMPIFVIGPISGALFIYAYFLQGTREVEEAAQEKATADQRKVEDVEKILFIDPMEIELGQGLSALVANAQGSNLLKRIGLIRKQLAGELGLVVPSIRIHDNLALNPQDYLIKIKGNEMAKGILYLNNFLAMNPGHVKQPLNGINTLEPAFGLPAIWIKASQRDYAISCGYVVADALTVLVTHLMEVIRTHANELLNRQEVSKLIENAKAYAPAVVAELIPAKLSYGQILRVLQNLLRERVSIRDFGTILETLADNCGGSSDADILTEFVRQGLSRSLTKQYISVDNAIHAIMLDPKVEQMLTESIQKSEIETAIVINPKTTAKLIQQTRFMIQEGIRRGVEPVFITAAPLRPYFHKLVERSLPRLPVLSLSEISSDVPVASLGVVTQDILTQ